MYDDMNCEELRAARANPDTPEEDYGTIDALIAAKCGGGATNGPGDGGGSGGDSGGGGGGPPVHP